MFEICSKKPSRTTTKKSPILSQEAYHWSPKYTLDPQFDGEPEKGFQMHDDDLINWEIPLIFKAIYQYLSHKEPPDINRDSLCRE